MHVETDQVREIFLAALKVPPAQRPAYLQEACAGAEPLRQQIERLLQAHLELGSIPEPSPRMPGATIDEPPTERPGTVIGPYKLLQQIGEGGMGTVFMAEQTQPVQRKVALKVIKPGMDSRQVIARFEAERQALAMMDHVNIARVFDGGTTGGEPGGVSPGRPYFVMELVHGVPITKYCDDNQLTPRERLELFVPVCQAIQHAHQKGIIHRDIKPSNVMVTLYDGKPVPKVIDFGVAKATEQKLTERTVFTQYGTMVGTLEYMSPEQAEMSALGVDTRSDIYSLGVLLYELLTGSTPLTHKRMKHAAYAEILRMIKEEEPPKPSTRLSDSGEALASISANRHTEPAKLTKLVKGELDWIVMKALEKDRSRRYETASGFALDVQRYLADEPVLACPPSAIYRLKKFVRRNKGVLAAAGMLGVVLLAAVGMVAGTIGWTARESANRRTDAEARAVEALAEAEPRLRVGNPHDSRLVAAAGRAESQLAGGLLRPELCQRVQELLADLKMLRRLEEIVLAEAGPEGTGIGMAGADSAYASAFRDYGVDMDAVTPREAGERLRSRAIAVRLASALDNWGRVRGDRKPGSEDWKRLLEVAWIADPDPWRTSYRRALDREVPLKVVEDVAADAMARELPPDSFLTIAGLMRGRGATSLAIDVLRHAQRQHPADFWINCELAYVLGDVARPRRAQEAIGYARAAVGIRPESPIARQVLGWCLNANGQPDEAESALRTALRLQPNNVIIHRNLGIALAAQGKVDEAIDCYRKAIKLEPNYFWAHYNLANAYRNKRQLDEAITWYRKTIGLNPKIAHVHVELGQTFAAKQSWDEAIDCYRKAIELEPDHFWAHCNLANAYRNKGQLDEAIAWYRKTIGLNPKIAHAHVELGLTFAAKQSWDEAIDCYRKAIELEPDHFWAHCNLANAYRNKGQLDEAIAWYRKTIGLNPKIAHAHVELGLTFSAKQSWDEALVEFREAITICREAKPDDSQGRKDLASAFSNAAWFLATNRDAKNRHAGVAVDVAKEAAALQPADANVWNKLGVAHYRAGQWKEAANALEKADQLLKGGDRTHRFFRAMAHWQLGEKEQARKWYDEAVQWLDAPSRKPGEQWPNFNYQRLFRAEAEKLMNVEVKKD